MIKVPSKLILFGEHSVLKGYKSIAASINLYGYLNLESITNEPTIKIIDSIGKIIYLSNWLDHNAKESLTIKLGTRIGCGLGSSAVISVILSKYFHRNPNSLSLEFRYLIDDSNEDQLQIKELTTNKLDRILATANRIENIFHGKSSGLDVTSSYVTGLILYQRYGYKNINIVPLQQYKILIFDSGLEKNTKKVLSKTINFKDTSIYEKMGKVAEEAEKLISDFFRVEDLYLLIRKNQNLLEELGVVPEIMKNEVRKLREMGIESKLTGAGCGGYLYTIVYKNIAIDNWLEVEIFHNI